MPGLSLCLRPQWNTDAKEYFDVLKAIEAVAAYLHRSLTTREILELPDEHLAALIAVGPMVFKVGTADVLGQVRLGSDSWRIELAQIDGGGEGVLLTLVAACGSICQTAWDRRNRMDRARSQLRQAQLEASSCP